jgi:hypothetical protein
MRRFLRVAALAVAVMPAVLHAQGATTCRFVQTRDICQLAGDFYDYMLPQLGLALGGGNPVLGSNTVIGKLGHFSVGLRATAFKGSLPQFDSVTASTTGVEARTIPVKDQWLPGPAVDVAVGLFRGVPLGVTRVGSVDAIASVIYLPSVGGGNNSNSDVTVETHTRFGFGGRVGLLEESIVVPAITFAYLQRGLPKISLSSQSSNGASFSVNQLDITVSTWRLIATKSFLLFALSGGFGGDTYKSSGALTARAVGQSESITLDRSPHRTNWFIDLTLNAKWVQIATELGGAGSTGTTTVNHFAPVAGASRIYYSFGLRAGF